MDIQARRLDHLGLVKGIIDELGIIDLINEAIPPDTREEVNAGQVVAAMICNGLGFTSKPLSLTPDFFHSKPVELLFGENITADMFNASKLSRVLDKLYSYGLEKLFAQIASKVASKMHVNMGYQSLDTTSISLTGEYDSESDEHCVQIKHGHSKDHRPDLKQVVVELMVSQDGGIPLLLKIVDGNASDNTIFKERCKALVENIKAGTWNDYCLIADSKLYHKKNADYLSQLNFITRAPNSIKAVQEAIHQACQTEAWHSTQSMHQTISYQPMSVTHLGFEQRWIVLRSDDSQVRAKKKVDKAIKKEELAIEKLITFMRRNPFSCKNDAESKAKEAAKKFKYHVSSELKIISTGRYHGKGKPSKNKEPDYFEHTVEASFELEPNRVAKDKLEGACIVMATNVKASSLNDVGVIERYKKQNEAIENTGFRFLKDPLFFTQSLFVKRADRVESTLFIMTLSLLVYSIGQRQVRAKIIEADETIPDQMKRPTQRPTLRWVFQLFEGINWIKSTAGTQTYVMIENIREAAKKIIRLLGEPILKYYPGCNVNCTKLET